jgi:hypothetical protein
MRTNFSNETGHHQEICTEFAQNTARPSDRRVGFPVAIRHRSSKAKIYRPAGKFNYYRVAYTVAGKRRMQTFANYPDTNPCVLGRFESDTGVTRNAGRKIVGRGQNQFCGLL